MKQYTTYEVGKPFPGPVPAAEGPVMELWKDGLIVLIQMPGLRREELRAFKRGFNRYSYLESTTPVPVAIWIFNFPKTHGPIDCNFNARLVKPEYIESYLSTEEGVKNLVTFYLLDGNTLKAMKAVGLDPDAVRLFHATIRKQLSIEYSQDDFGKYLRVLFHYDSSQLFSMGTAFKHRKKG